MERQGHDLNGSDEGVDDAGEGDSATALSAETKLRQGE